MKKNLFTLFALALLFSVTACDNNDDDLPVIENKEEEVDPEQQQAEIQARMDSLINVQFIQQVCRIDTVGIIPQYTARYGEAIEEATPAILYKAADTLPQAEVFWDAMVPIMDAESVVQDATGTRSYAREGVGSIAFTPGDGVNTIATIDIDLDVLPDVKQLVFIPTQLWPHNQDATVLKLGYIVEDTKDSNRRRYICVRNCTTRKNADGKYIADGILFSLGGYDTKKHNVAGIYGGQIYFWQEENFWRVWTADIKYQTYVNNEVWAELNYFLTHKDEAWRDAISRTTPVEGYFEDVFRGDRKFMCNIYSYTQDFSANQLVWCYRKWNNDQKQLVEKTERRDYDSYTRKSRSEVDDLVWDVRNNYRGSSALYFGADISIHDKNSTKGRFDIVMRFAK